MHSSFQYYPLSAHAGSLAASRSVAGKSSYEHIKVSGLAIICAVALLGAYLTDDPLTNAAFGLFGFLLLVFAPRIGILAYYLLITLSSIMGITNNQPSIPIGQYGTITYTGIAALSFLAGSLMMTVLRLKQINLKRAMAEFKGMRLYALFSVVVLVITLVFHPGPDGFKGVIGYLTPTVLFLSISLFFKPDDYVYLRDMLLISLTVAVCRVPSFIASDASYSMVKGGYAFVRYKPDALSEVDYSLFIVALVPITLFGFFGAKSRRARIIWLLAGAISVLSIVPFYARAAFIALGMIMLLQLFLRQQYQRAWIYTALSGALIVFSPAWFLASDIISTGVSDSQANTFADRLRNLWIPALPQNVGDFMLGIGPREIGNYMFRIVGEYLPGIHSIYLTILLEAGFISLAFFVIANATTILAWIREIRASEPDSIIQKQITALVLPLFVYLIGASTSTVSYNLFYIQIFLFLALGQMLLKLKAQSTTT